MKKISKSFKTLVCDEFGQLSYRAGVSDSPESTKRIRLRWKALFPESHPDGYGVLLNEKGEEEFFVENLASVDQALQAVLRKSLERSSCGIEILLVLEVMESAEIRTFEVQTPFGQRKVFCKNDDWPEAFQLRGLQMTDVFGDQYFVSDIDAMDLRSQKLLEAFYDRMDPMI